MARGGGILSVIAWVAGATGFTGREVVRELRARAHRVVAHVRPDSARLFEWQERFAAEGAEVDSSPWNTEALTERLRALRPQLVYALIGTTKARARLDVHSTYANVDYGLTLMLLEAAVASGASPRFVYLSAAGAGPQVRGEYMRVRWQCEEAVRGSGLPYLIARPSFIVGPDRDERRVKEELGAKLGDAALGLVGRLGARKLSDRFRSITNVQLARALVHLGVADLSGREGVDAAVLRAV